LIASEDGMRRSTAQRELRSGEVAIAALSNLLVMLCSDKDTQPIVNTGTLHS
jgi:hypothetical protein